MTRGGIETMIDVTVIVTVTVIVSANVSATALAVLRSVTVILKTIAIDMKRETAVMMTATMAQTVTTEKFSIRSRQVTMSLTQPSKRS